MGKGLCRNLWWSNTLKDSKHKTQTIKTNAKRIKEAATFFIHPITTDPGLQSRSYSRPQLWCPVRDLALIKKKKLTEETSFIYVGLGMRARWTIWASAEIRERGCNTRNQATKSDQRNGWRCSDSGHSRAPISAAPKPWLNYKFTEAYSLSIHKWPTSRSNRHACDTKTYNAVKIFMHIFKST